MEEQAAAEFYGNSENQQPFQRMYREGSVARPEFLASPNTRLPFGHNYEQGVGTNTEMMNVREFQEAATRRFRMNQHLAQGGGIYNEGPVVNRPQSQPSALNREDPYFARARNWNPEAYTQSRRRPSNMLQLRPETTRVIQEAGPVNMEDTLVTDEEKAPNLRVGRAVQEAEVRRRRNIEDTHYPTRGQGENYLNPFEVQRDWMAMRAPELNTIRSSYRRVERADEDLLDNEEEGHNPGVNIDRQMAQQRQNLRVVQETLTDGPTFREARGVAAFRLGGMPGMSARSNMVNSFMYQPGGGRSNAIANPLGGGVTYQNDARPNRYRPYTLPARTQIRNPFSAARPRLDSYETPTSFNYLRNGVGANFQPFEGESIARQNPRVSARESARRVLDQLQRGSGDRGFGG